MSRTHTLVYCHHVSHACCHLLLSLLASDLCCVSSQNSVIISSPVFLPIKHEMGPKILGYKKVKKSIEENPFPAHRNLRLTSQKQIRTSAFELQINHNKQYKKTNGLSSQLERKKEKRERERGYIVKRSLRIVTPFHRSWTQILVSFAIPF